MESIGNEYILVFWMNLCILFRSLPQSFIAGSVAGITNTIVLTPVERVKCLLQVHLYFDYFAIHSLFL